MYDFYLGGVLLPVTPASMTVKIANQNKTITLINEGEVNILKRPGLSKISFSALLPNREYCFARYQGGYRDAQYFMSVLEDLKNGCVPVDFNVLRIDDSGTLLMESNPMTVSLENYELTEDAEKYGVDVMAKIELLQWQKYGTKYVEFQQIEEAKTATVTEKRDTSTKPIETTYTVVQGDNLWDIAKIKLGDGLRMDDIYQLNRDTIEAEARKHGLASSSNGKWIYPGMVLKLPG